MAGSLPFPLHVLFNPTNQEYGGKQKIGYHLHDQEQIRLRRSRSWRWALPGLLKPLQQCEADAVFGTRMLRPGGASKGAMPLYKFLGDKV
jgi:hypothetical protein